MSMPWVTITHCPGNSGFSKSRCSVFKNELTRADVTATAIFQATLPIPGRVIPNDRRIEQAVLLGERRFAELGCATCHLPSLPLDQSGWIFSEPNPFNPAPALVTVTMRSS